MSHKFFVFLLILAVFAACVSKPDPAQMTPDPALEQAMEEGESKEVHGTEIKADAIQLSNPLDQNMVTTGQKIYDSKCLSCHKLTDEKLVGPGWKGVTRNRKPEWIMNMITNVDMMLESDPEAQKLLEQCLVRMPNQNVTIDDARALLEFMRQNDGEK